MVKVWPCARHLSHPCVFQKLQGLWACLQPGQDLHWGTETWHEGWLADRPQSFHP